MKTRSDASEDLLDQLPRVILASCLSRLRRNGTGGVLAQPPPPGTPLLVSLAWAFEHTGIYLGSGQVAELHGDGQVKSVSLTEFVNGSGDMTFSIRTGTRIFAACDGRKAIPLASACALDQARMAVERHLRPGYDCARMNCHLFTAACAVGMMPSLAFYSKLFGEGIVSIDRLESVLAKSLNRGRFVSWRGVAPSKSFMYELTTNKLVKLRRF